MPSNEFRTLKRKEQEGEGVKRETVERGEGGGVGSNKGMKGGSVYVEKQYQK